MKKQFHKSPRHWMGLVLLLAMLFATPVGYGLAQGTMVTIDPASKTVAVGATTTVNIHIANVTDLYGAEAHLTFNPTLLEVVDADPNVDGVQIQAGTFLSPDFTAQNAVDQAIGKIDFAIAQTPDHDPVSGSGALATITFRGKAGGSSAISFVSVILSDQDGQSISTGTQDGSITVSGPSPTPTNTPTPTYTQQPTDTPTATGTPTASPTLPGEAVCTQAAAIFAVPDANSAKLGYVKVGESVTVVGRASGDNWLYIQSDAGVEGFVWQPYFNWPGDLEALPTRLPTVTVTPPTPAPTKKFFIDYKGCQPHASNLGSVKGQVFDAQGNVIPGAQVEIWIDGQYWDDPANPARANVEGWYEWVLGTDQMVRFVGLYIDGQPVPFESEPDPFEVVAKGGCFQRIDFREMVPQQ